MINEQLVFKVTIKYFNVFRGARNRFALRLEPPYQSFSRILEAYSYDLKFYDKVRNFNGIQLILFDVVSIWAKSTIAHESQRIIFM